jgi:hypothetical protein
MNVSALVRVTPSQLPILGFAVADDGAPRQWLIRAIGDGLQPFGVSNTLPEPKLWLGNSNGTIAEDRGNAASSEVAPLAAQVGAFPARPTWSPILLPNAPTSDSGLVSILDPGTYSTRVIPATAGQGWALLEVYDSFVGGASGGLKNASVRTVSGDNAGPVRLGFVVGGPSPVKLLIRGVGPTLRVFGVSTPIGHPRLTVFRANGQTVATNAGWANDPAIAQMSNLVGAFAYPPASLDAALIVELEPGAYTAEVTNAADGTAGEALVELYTIAR